MHSLSNILSDFHLANSKGQFTPHLTWPLCKIRYSWPTSSPLKHFLPRVHRLLPLPVLWHHVGSFSLDYFVGPHLLVAWVLTPLASPPGPSSFASHKAISVTQVTDMTKFRTPPRPLFWALDPHIQLPTQCFLLEDLMFMTKPPNFSPDLLFLWSSHQSSSTSFHPLARKLE